MSSWNPFKRRKKQAEQATILEPSEIKDPNNYESFMQRGWALHARGEHEKAESDFRRALSYSPESVDAAYAMGLVLKSQGNTGEAAEMFNKTMELIKQGKIEEHSKSEMMRRLTLAHINELTTGDWNLEDEIWHQS